MNTVAIPKRKKSRDDWLKERRKGLGGTDSSVVLGYNKWMTRQDLYLDKLGYLPAKEETRDMKRGNVMEPVIADLFAEETGRRVKRHPENVRHPDFPWMLVNIDRHIVAFDSRGPGALEIKCPRSFTFEKYKREGLPEMYIIQLQHGMAVKGWKWGSFAIFNADSFELIFFDVNADTEIQQRIIESDKDFWFNHIEARVMPNEDVVEPEIALPEVNKSDIKRIETEEFHNALKSWQESDEIVKEATLLKESAKERLKKCMGNNYGVAEGFHSRCYYSMQKGKKTFDKKRFMADHPEIDLSKYDKEGKPFETFKTYFLKSQIGE